MARRGGFTFTMSPIARAGLAGIGNVPAQDDRGTGLGYTDEYGNEITSSDYQVQFPASGGAAWPTSAGGTLDTSQIIQMAKDLGIAYLAYDQQKMVQEINIERIRRGMPIIPSSALAPTMNFGLSPDTMQYLLIGGAALLAVMLLSGGRRHAH